jgi:heat shock protein HslJ
MAGCAVSHGAFTGSATAADASGSWVLRAGTGPSGDIRIFGEHRMTLVIDGDQAGGQSGCNIYGGTVTFAGGAIRISAMSMTEMACADDRAMQSEAEYLAALGAVTRWARDGDQLVLTGEGTRLTYELVPPVPDAALVGTSWVLDSLVQGDAVSSVQGEATLVFAADGTVTGSTGCREFDGSYAVNDDQIDMTDLVVTDQGCPPGFEAQDQHVLQVLGARITASADGATLTLLADGGQGLVYHAAPGIQ